MELLKKIWAIVNTANSEGAASKLNNVGVWIGAAIGLAIGVQQLLCKLGVATSCVAPTIPSIFGQ